MPSSCKFKYQIVGDNRSKINGPINYTLQLNWNMDMQNMWLGVNVIFIFYDAFIGVCVCINSIEYLILMDMDILIFAF